MEPNQQAWQSDLSQTVWETMNIYDKFHKAVSMRINPTFDRIETLVDKHPKLTVPVNATLIAAFPAWCVLAAFVNARRTL